MPEVSNIPPGSSYWPADPVEPVLDISIGDALHAATSTWRTRTALIDGTPEEQTRRRWTFEELLTESEKVARGHYCSVSFQANTLRSGRPIARSG